LNIPKARLKDRSGRLIGVCTRCIYDEGVAGISFDDFGVCNYCIQVDSLKDLYGTGSDKGVSRLRDLVSEMKKKGRGLAYDCVIGVSGGTDSSYLIHLAKTEWGLRPLAVHYDNTWNTATATQNMRKVLDHYDVDLTTYVVNNGEMDDIFKSFFLAGVAEIEAPTDLAYAFTLRREAAKHGVKFILEGHSFTTEGVTPLTRNYFDGRYVRSIHSQYGSRKLKTYPLMTMSQFLKSAVLDAPKFIRPFWYMDYSKERAREVLTSSCDWEYYGGHHLENRMTAFCHGVYLPRKFQTDMRNNTLSARVRSGLLSRDEAWEEYLGFPTVEKGLVDYFSKRLRLDRLQYESVMATRPRNWYEFPTYKKYFELLRPVFWLLTKWERVPRSFYLKYCFRTST